MGVKDFLDYNNYIQLQNKNLEIWGQPCTIYVPRNSTNLGYENVTEMEVDRMDSDRILANRYDSFRSRIWINFTVEKSVFYKFNYFPEDAEELSMAFMTSNSKVRENSYIRTAVPEQTSVWGDMIFQVVKIQDVGLAKTLKRIYFLKPTSANELYSALGVNGVNNTTGA